MKLSRRNLLGTGMIGLAAPALVSLTPQLAQAARPSAAPVTASTRRIGDLEITTLLDGTIDIAPAYIGGYDETAAVSALARQHLPPAPEGLPIPVLGFVIRNGDKLVAIDTGTVDGFAPRLGGYHQALKDAGFNAADFDAVAITHLHPDHAGGLLDAKGAAAFPNAEILISAPEWDFWHDDANIARMPEGLRGFFDIARAQVKPYAEQVKMVSDGESVLPGMEIVALPGHTPGHFGLRINSAGQDLLIWGDLMHLTKYQFDHPTWSIAFDMDPELAAQTRAKIYDMAATDGVLSTGHHVDFPGFGYVERRGNAYHFAPAAHDYLI